MGDDPPYLAVSTEVSAKYKGAFCEAKIRKVVRIVKCKVTFKGGLGTTLVSDDQIKGTLRVGATVEVKHPEKNTFVEAIVNKIQDCSQYTVVFDDGDITTLRRSALCLKSGRHFNESETLDQLPLTHPEHFSNPVVGGRRGVRRRNINADNDKDDSSDEEDIPTKKGRKGSGREADMGKVVFVESTDKKKTKDNYFPALIVNPSAQETVKIRTKDDYLVRSFRDGIYYTVPKKETKDFKDSVDKYEYTTNPLRLAVEKARNYLEKDELPAHWDRDILFRNVNAAESNNSEEEQNSDSDSSEDDPTEDKDRFVAQLYKFMDDRGTPINKVPLVCNKDLDLYKLYKIVKAHGGYNKVSNGNQWKAVTIKMGYGSMPTTSTINLVRQSYKKCVYHYEEFNRKLGVSMISRATPTTKSRSSRQFFREKHASGSAKDFKKEEPEEVKKEEEKEKKPAVVAEVDSEAQNSDNETKKSEQSDESRRSRSRQESRSRTKEPEESPEKTPKATQKKKRASLKEKEKEPPPKEEPSSPAVAPKKGNRGKKKETEEEPEKSEHEEVLDHIGNNVLVDVGHKLLVYYGPQSDGKVTYEAKVLKSNLKTKTFLVHYTGWNTRYDEWIKRTRISENLTFKPDQGKPAQGRGPAGYAETTESESSSSTKVSTKSPKRKPRPVPTTSTAASGTRSKSGITRRKRFSGESEIIKKRKTRQKSGSVVAIPSVSGSDAESSDLEDKMVPIVSTPPSSVSSASSSRLSNKIGSREKRTEDDDASSSSTSSSISKVAKDVGEKDKQNQVIDLKQIRSEMKGLDKMVKAPTSPSTSAKSTSPSGNELKLDIYDFQEDANDAPKLKMFAPRSPDKKEEVVVKPVLPDIDTGSKSVQSDVVATKESDKEKETNNKTETINSSKVSAAAESKELKLESTNHEAEKEKEKLEVAVVSPDISPTIVNEPSRKTVVLPPVAESKPVAVGISAASNVSTKTKPVIVSQPSHILKVVTTPREGKIRATAPTPNKRLPVVSGDIAHPPPPPLVRSSIVAVAPKAVIAVPTGQPRPPLLIQRPVTPLNSGSPIVRLTVAGQQETLIRPPSKVEAVNIPSEPNNVTVKPVETKILPSATKQPELFPHINPQTNMLSSTSSSSSLLSSQPVTPVAEMKGIVSPPTKVPSLVQIQPNSTDIPVKLTAVAPKSVVKEKKSVIEPKSNLTLPPVAATSTSAASATPMTTPKKKTKKIISKKFVESESDSSTEAESPKRAGKKRQRSETPKKSPLAKKKKLEIPEKSPVQPPKRFTPKSKISNSKAVDIQIVSSSEIEKTPKLSVSMQEMTESVIKKKLEVAEEKIEKEKSIDIEIMDVVRPEKSVDKPEKELVKQEKYFEKKNFERVEKNVDNAPKNLDASEKRVQDKISVDIPTIGRDTVLKSTRGQEKDVEVIDKSNETKLELIDVEMTVEKNVDKIDKKVDKTSEKKERNSEKSAEKKEKEKIVEKPVEKREKNIDRSFEKPDRQSEKQEKSFEKKEKNLDKKDRHSEKKDKNVEKEKVSEKKEFIESEKKLEIREKGAEKMKSMEKKEKLAKDKEKTVEKQEKAEKNAEKKIKSLEKIEKVLEAPEKSSQKQDKQLTKPGKSPKKMGNKLEKEKQSKANLQKPTKPEKVSKTVQKQVKNIEKMQNRQLKKLEEKQIDRAAKLFDKQVKEIEKPTEQLQKNKQTEQEKEDNKEDVKKDIKSFLEAYKTVEAKVVAQTAPLNPVIETVTVDPSTVKASKSTISKNEESVKSVHPLTTACSVNLGGSLKSVEKATILPTISVTITSKVMSLNLPELSNKSDLVGSTIIFASKIEDVKTEKQEEPQATYISPISPMAALKEDMSISLTTDEVIAKSPEPEDEIEEATNPRLKAQKQEPPVQEDFPSNLLLCEEIIPGSPPGDNSSRYSFDNDANESNLEKDALNKVSSISKTEAKDKDGISEDVTMSNYVEDTTLPNVSQPARSEVNKILDKPSSMLEQNENDDFSKPSMGDQNIFNPRQDAPMSSMDTTPPLTPDSSSISSGSPRNEMGRGSPRADRDSSKSKESSDGDVDSAECLKNSDHAEESSVSSDMGRKTLKVSLPTTGTSGSTRKPRSTECRGSRNVSPPIKRRRIIRRKSPEEVVRSYPYRGRASSGRRPQSGTSNDRDQDQHKTMPPPPPINIGRPPRSSRFTNFIPELDESMDSEQRVGLITQAIQDLRERYVTVKSEMTSFERRRKRWKRREREKAERVARQEVRMNT